MGEGSFLKRRLILLECVARLKSFLVTIDTIITREEIPSVSVIIESSDAMKVPCYGYFLNKSRGMEKRQMLMIQFQQSCFT